MKKNKKSFWTRFIIWFRVSIAPYFREHRWLILISLAIIAFLLGFSGGSIVHPNQSILDRVYITLQLFVLKSEDLPGTIPLSLNIARFMAPALTFVSLAVIVSENFYNHLELFFLWLLHKNHVVICGLGYIGPVMAKHFCEEGFTVVAIEKDPTRSEIEYCKKKGAIVLIGDATEERILKRAQVKKARFLFAVTGDDELNAKVVSQVKEVIIGRVHPLNCFVHIVDLKFANVLRAAQMPVQGESSLLLEFINIYQNASYCILDCLPPLLPDSKTPPDFRLIIIGMGRMGESLLVHLAKRWQQQYGKNPEKKIEIAIIDRKADERKASIEARYKALKNYCNIDAKKMEITSSSFYDAQFLFDMDGKNIVNGIFVCTPDESLNYSSALYLMQKLKNNSVPILIRTVHSRGFARFFEELHDRNADQFKNFHVFPLVSCGCCIERILNGVNEVIAQALHERYLIQKKMEGADPGEDPAMVPWNTLDSEYKEENRSQARHMGIKLKEGGYAIVSRPDWDEPLSTYKDDKDIEDLAIMEHDRWMASMVARGWTYGKEKSREKKTNPNIVPWDTLSDEPKNYDRIFIREYPSILAMVDLKIVRTAELYPEKASKTGIVWKC